MKDNPEQEAQWIAAMVDLEDERGAIVPGGAQGGVVARARRARAAASAAVVRPSAVARARARVRRSFQAAEKSSDSISPVRSALETTKRPRRGG
jgi:hypothetical protein